MRSAVIGPGVGCAVVPIYNAMNEWFSGVGLWGEGRGGPFDI